MKVNTPAQVTYQIYGMKAGGIKVFNVSGTAVGSVDQNDKLTITSSGVANLILTYSAGGLTASDSFSLKIGSVLDYVMLADSINGSRRTTAADTTLHMVSKNNSSRSAQAIAVKAINATPYWLPNQPMWSGLVNGVANQKNILTFEDGDVTATAQGPDGNNIDKTAHVDIVQYYKNSYTPEWAENINKINGAIGIISASFSGGSADPTCTFYVKGEWENVDKYKSPDIGNKITVTVGGKTPKYTLPKDILLYGTDLIYVRVGFFLNGSIQFGCGGGIVLDDSKEFGLGKSFTGTVNANALGGITLSAGAEVLDLSNKVVGEAKVKANVPIDLKAPVTWNEFGSPIVDPTLKIGPVSVTLTVSVRTATKKYVFDGGVFVPISEKTWKL